MAGIERFQGLIGFAQNVVLGYISLIRISEPLLGDFNSVIEILNNPSVRFNTGQNNPMTVKMSGKNNEIENVKHRFFLPCEPEGHCVGDMCPHIAECESLE